MRTAVIDIGSNAIRAVVYESESPGAAEIYNEKFKSDVLALLDLEEIDVRHPTYNIFAYYKRVFMILKVSSVTCVATEVLRSHVKAEDFTKIILEKFGFDITILKGVEESRLSAAGLTFGIPNASGLVVDLGGGSIEFAEVCQGTITHLKSLPLGTKNISKNYANDADPIVFALESALQHKHYDNIYLIGGAFLLISRCYMDYTQSTIKNLHNISIDVKEFAKFIQHIENLQKFQPLFKQYKINRSALVMMKCLIDLCSPNNFIISTFGLKEGVHFSNVCQRIGTNNIDLAIEKCMNFANVRHGEIDFESYEEIFKNMHNMAISGAALRVLKMAIILSRPFKHVDRNYRADMVINFITLSDIPFTQQQRAMLIVAMVHILSGKYALITKHIKTLLTRREYAEAQTVGAFIRIAMLVDGPELHKAYFNIIEDNRFFELQVDQILPRTIFEKVCDQLKFIASTIRYISSPYHGHYNNAEPNQIEEVHHNPESEEDF